MRVASPRAQRRPSVSIRLARSAERHALEELQRRASLHGGRYREQLLSHPEVIQIPAPHLEQGLVRVAEQGTRVVGFAALLAAVDGACELDGIFVEPELMGSGVGRALVDDAVAVARARGAARIDVVANPEAVGFYRRLGFTDEGEVATRFGSARRMRLAVGR